MKSARGFTYIGLLLAVALAGLAAAAAGTLWSTQVTRERETQLLQAGEEIARAIGRYRADHPNIGDGYPKSFDELLRDPHVPVLRRYLRKVYLDPMTGSTEWGVVRSAAGGITGVYSLSRTAPLRTVLPESVTVTGTAQTHADWRFLAIASAVSPNPASGRAGGDAQIFMASPQPDIRDVQPLPTAVLGGMGAEQAERSELSRCERITRADAGTCAEIRRRYGPNAGDPCTASAAARAAACADGSPIPGLQMNVR